ncbi:signal peptidase I [Sulfurospirillum barnesii]|uniref:Signal peptidase I n=1 Tax=Sulfurospirillum barnesii (strain ATCC 700032 / DSM 10660 / SES-3) TaxID=760154 RepID=I3XZM1_SULBS|nr:signal peptidase I [Sulfurospirillum barnesii]AFL69395.1 signal peptidase I [Sulfurospirillum barnesii SES-3]
MENNIKENKKSVFIAIILNLLFIGAGHYYIKDTKKAFIFFPIMILALSLMYYLSTLVEIGIFVGLIYFLCFSIYIYSIIDVIKLIKNEGIRDYESKDIKLLFFICAYALLSILIYTYSPLKVYSVPSNNMATTIMKDDRIVVNKLNKEVKRGDIIAFRYSKDEKVHYVKRCIAIEGDEILFQEEHFFIHFSEGDEYIKANFPQEKIKNIGGRLWVDNPYRQQFSGIQYDEKINLFDAMASYLSSNHLAMKPAQVEDLPLKEGYKFNTFYAKVEKDHFYMVGDNRDHSNDSRFWGSVPKENIIGKAGSILINFKNLSRMGKLLQ